MKTRHPQPQRTNNSPKQDTRFLGSGRQLKQRLSQVFSRIRQGSALGSARSGFTIVELLIVVVVIAILAAITLVAYNGITVNARESALKADLNTTAKKVGISQAETGAYPSVKPSGLPDTIQYSQTNAGQGFCATASKDGKAFHITESGTIQGGACAGHTIAGGGGGGTVATMQSFTTAQCGDLETFTGSNTSAVIQLTDNRGGTERIYDVAKLADGKCWMLTNLKLGSTSGSITLTPVDSNVASNFILPQLVTTGSSYDDPRVYGPVPNDTGSGETNYGYLYNFPAATAGETRTSLTTGNAQHSICPASWRLPSGGSTSSDFGQLDVAFGGTGTYVLGSPSTSKWQPSGPFKGVSSGSWTVHAEFADQGNPGSLWSASARPDHSDGAFVVRFVLFPSYVEPGGSSDRAYGLGVRCLLN